MLNILNSSDFNLRWKKILQIEMFLYFLIRSGDLSSLQVVKKNYKEWLTSIFIKVYEQT